jgi:LDH2 family malate/lactate/ureidoglycolate dehydrogenase
VKWNEENQIAIRVSNSKDTFFTWPNFAENEGFGQAQGGIASKILLLKKHKIHIPENSYSPLNKWGTYFATTEATSQKATFRCLVNVENQSSKAASVKLVTELIDSEGNTRTDTEQILIDLVKGTAALTPVGGLGEDTAGYKGYGYATVVEILSAALQQGSFLKGLLGFSPEGKKQPYHLGHFFVAINIDAFCDVDDFKKTTGDILRDLRNSRKAPGCDRIYTAGEKEYEAFCKRSKTGVPVNEALQKVMRTLKAECKLDQYEFPF